MKAADQIPLHTLNNPKTTGIDIHRLPDQNFDLSGLTAAHRDDHYMFAFQEMGTCRMMVDFKERCVEGCAVFVVRPGQVHYAISTLEFKAWVIAVDVSWVDESFRQLFHENALRDTPIAIKDHQASVLKNCMLLLEEVYTNHSGASFHNHTLRHLVEGCIGMFASIYNQAGQCGENSDRRISVISRQFKNHLQDKFKTMKSPSAYAGLLNISPVYLNEAVKQYTGFSVSYWIQQEIVLEAKRMLYYTSLTVKEIAHALGYEDQTYFIRLFGKVAGMPPQQFRLKYRK